MKTGLPIAHHLPEIRRTVERGQRSTLLCAIASVDPGGLPDVTPVAMVFLRPDQTGFYFDQHGTVGTRRLATTDELRQIQQRVQRTRWLKGNRLL